jgi:hypothetical protein
MHMTRLQAAGWSVLFTLAGGGVLTYLLTTVPPRLPDGNVSQPLVALLLFGLLLAVTGIAAAIAMALHRRYPGLGGGDRSRPPRPAVALRQGFLFACAILVNALLAFFQVFDVIFLVATPLLAGLLEAYLQHRPARRS